MSTSETPNPYAAPAPGYVPEAPAMNPSGRPRWYTLYCVVAIVLGSLGIMNALTGTLGLMFQSQLQSGFRPPQQPGMSPEFTDRLNAMQSDLQAVNARFFYWFLAAQFLLLVVALLLLLGGIQALQLKRSGAGLLANAFLFASIFDVGRLIVTTFNLMESWQAFDKHFGPLMRESQPSNGPPLPQEAIDMVTTMANVSFGAGACLLVAWSIAKVAFYLSGWVYLQKPKVRALLQD